MTCHLVASTPKRLIYRTDPLPVQHRSDIPLIEYWQHTNKLYSPARVHGWNIGLPSIPDLVLDTIDRECRPSILVYVNKAEVDRLRRLVEAVKHAGGYHAYYGYPEPEIGEPLAPAALEALFRATGNNVLRGGTLS